MTHSTYYLNNWLYFATKDIGRIGKHRIEVEITAHYERAYRVALDGGHPEEEAKTMSLQSLGDAHEAQKRFYKTQLSTKDEEFINQYVKMHKFPILNLLLISLMSVLTVSNVAFFNIYIDPFDLVNHPYVMLSMLLYGAVLCWSQRRLFRGHVRNMIGHELMFLALCLSMFFPEPSQSNILLWANLSAALFLTTFFYFVRWRPMLSILRKAPKQLSEEELNLLPNVNIFGKEIS